MATHSIEWFRANNCDLAKDLKLFAGLWQLTQGDPCKDCNCKDECFAWKAEQQVAQQAAQQAQAVLAENAHLKTVKDGITNAEVARLLKISKRKASKLRAEGKLDMNGIRVAKAARENVGRF